ncbi:competence protein ComEC [Rhodobacter aestuarii]|uniref:Competence protein ComEC n=1 Tax=Rhodobacter aestuarii TaxID=453582 RepID=A0A1N7NNQ5_9RHOB|nr:ComEC/Rec2 family competence protein [Rhodobacter aestuarii]PTV94654.1 competence protein ComEC [Rhodobacter aestuarii]SIS99976.1 competence protein ComEC [Rhodobacter aestuarii]
MARGSAAQPEDLPKRPQRRVVPFFYAVSKACFAGLDDPFGALDRAQINWVLWAPFALGLGIGFYFALPVDPSGPLLWGLGAAGIGALLLWLRGPGYTHLPAVFLLFVALGLLLANHQAHSVAAPVLSSRYYGPVEGRIIRIDRSSRDVLRLTLDQARLLGKPANATPVKLRIALHGPLPRNPLEPGQRVMTTAHLSPPNGPTEPGAWDFRRNAWFAQLGALGYTRSPVLLIAPPKPDDWGLAAHRWRMALSSAMQARIAGQAGAVSAALMTGDRSGITEATNDMMRASNLYHMVSISGLHMGMLAGFVFAAIRHGLALWGWGALRLPTKKIAAAVALVAATLYLWISGADIATQRSWIMIAIMLTAVLLDRRALSLQTVALAALVLLALWPDSLLGPGFQMSFAATTALILIAKPWPRLQNHIPQLLRPVALLVLTSAVAGLVTAPIAAAHFGRMAHYGILANLLAVPVMGLVVMPAGVLAACLAPFGLAGPALWAMGKGTDWVLWVADWVAGLGGAQTALVAPPGWVLPVLALAAAGLVLGRGILRLLSLGALVVATLGWSLTPRPMLLIAQEGALVGLMTPAGRALSKASPSYTAERWLEADGDTATPEQAAERAGFTGPKGQRQAIWQGRPLVHLSGKGALDALPMACQNAALVVLAAPAPKGFQGDCTVLDTRSLARSGALAFDALGRSHSVAQLAGHRLWTDPPK